METSSMRSRRHRNPQQKTDVQNESSEHAVPFFSNGQVQTKKEPAFFQPKLTIGKADDPYEREADAVADKVVNKTNGHPPSPSSRDASTIQNKEISAIQRLATPDEDKMPATNDGRMAEDKKIQEKPMVQKMEAPKKEEEKPAVQKMEAPKEEEKPAVQKMEAPKEEEKPAVQKMEAPKEEEKPVQAKAESGGSVASQAVASKIDSTKGRGEPMPEKTKSKMESAFGRDFSDVHIHNDTSSVEMNRELNAQAFTHGKDIYFNSGKFNPQNTEGAHLLAHELTHVVQQNGEMINKGGDEDEKEAKAVAAAKATLKGTFGFVSVEGSKEWTSKELDLVKDALMKLSADDKKVLKGLRLIRSQNINGTDSRTAGLFSTDEKNEASITIGDIAFESADPLQAQLTIIHEVGHGIASLKNRAALDEANLAVDVFNKKVEISNAANDLLGNDSPAAKAYTAKFEEYKTKNAESNAKIDAANEKNEARNALVPKFNSAKTVAEQQPLGEQMKQLQAEKEALLKESKVLAAEAAKLKAEADKLNAAYKDLEKDYKSKKLLTDAAGVVADQKKEAIKGTMIAPATLAKIAQGADTAQSQLDTTAKASLTGISDADKKEGDAYNKAVEQVSLAVKLFHNETKGQTFGEKEVDARIKLVDEKIAERMKAKDMLTKTNAKNGLLASLTATEKSQDDYFKMAKAQALAHERKAIIQTFVEFVEANNIPVTLTKYAADSWPHKPEEFYAEAYSFFLVKPKELEVYNLLLFNWFKTGKYKSM